MNASTRQHQVGISLVPVYDVGKDDGSYFIVSDVIAGHSLAERIQKNRPSHREAARIVAEVAEALGHANQNGIVAHFDLKPSNILLDTDGRAFLTDFGIAISDADYLREKAKSLGTLAYASPEQVTLSAIDPRTDVYSLGVVLFELLTGRLPFDASNPAVLSQQIAGAKPQRPRSIDPAIPESLERISLKCLEKKAEDRYDNAKALADALRAWLKAPPGQRRKWRIVATVLGCFAILSATGFFLLSSKKQPIEAEVEEDFDDSADRRAAAWVIKSGGSVNHITNSANIPQSRFKAQVIQLQGSINAKNNPDVTDEGLANLEGLVHLHTLNLAAAKIDGGGLKNLGQSTKLRWLSLECSTVNDGGVAQLSALANLRYLNLLSTPITEGSIPHLVNLKSLEHLVLSGTKVSEAGIKELQTALPKCNFIR